MNSKPTITFLPPLTPPATAVHYPFPPANANEAQGRRVTFYFDERRGVNDRDYRLYDRERHLRFNMRYEETRSRKGPLSRCLKFFNWVEHEIAWVDIIRGQPNKIHSDAVLTNGVKELVNIRQWLCADPNTKGKWWFLTRIFGI